MIPVAHGDQAEMVGGLDTAVRTALFDLGLIGWTVPAVALGVPGILVVIVVMLQLVGGTLWLPVARRVLSRSSTPTAPGVPDRGGRRPGR